MRLDTELSPKKTFLSKVLTFTVLIFFFIPACAFADCKCYLDFNNGFDNFDGSVNKNKSVTIKQIKTAKRISSNVYGTYKTQWSGSRKVYDAGHSVFKFNVDFCGENYKARFIRKDKKKCTLSLLSCGSNSNPTYALCAQTDWR